MPKIVSLALLVVLAAACAASPPASPVVGSDPPPAATSSPPGATSPPPGDQVRHGVAGLIADLADAGAAADVRDSFNGEPLAMDGTLVCVAGEALRVYSYGLPEEAAAAAGRIDPRDPSNVGTAIVEWVGTPRFWLRDRVIIVYQGNDEQTIALLSELLGEPFAQGVGRPALLPDGC